MSTLLFTLYQSIEGTLLKFRTFDFVDGSIRFEPHPDDFIPYLEKEFSETNLDCTEHNENEQKRANELLDHINKTLQNLPSSVEYKSQRSYLENVIGEFQAWFDNNAPDHGCYIKKINITDALWSVADDLRLRTNNGEFHSYREAYTWWCKRHLHKGRTITFHSLENEYSKAKSAGKVD